VDDEEPVRKALWRLIRVSGYDVATFESGADFLASVDRRAPACVILDLHLPDMNGFEIQDRLAKERPLVPVIVITGHDLPEARARVLAAGASAYFRKPVDGQALLDTIASTLAIVRGPEDRPRTQ
jgi:two-component system response regulator FixJ